MEKEEMGIREMHGTTGCNCAVITENEAGNRLINNLCSLNLNDDAFDVSSCEESISSSADHLVVMVHGIVGSATDWQFAADLFVRSFPGEVIVHCSESNISKLTLDGVDVMGERLAIEVLEVVQRWPTLRKISFVAHSVGGLVARYAIGKLFTKCKLENEDPLCSRAHREGCRASIGGLEPINFITVATPHLGSRGNKQVPFLLGVNAFEKAASLVIHWIFRRTGRHLFLTDNDDGKLPLLRRMTEDQHDCYFMSALRLFKRRVAYSNVCYDHIVGWGTSSIRRSNELPKWEERIDHKYPHIVCEEFCKASEARSCENISTDSDNCDDLEGELVDALSSVSWEKVDVSFHTCRQRYAAHSVIQVKDHVMHAEGADVIQHMIDHFLL